jgi:hypothetical protein
MIAWICLPQSGAGITEQQILVMKSRHISFALSALCFFLVAACNKPADFTGFWKTNCTDAFGVQIKKQTGNSFSVSFCGPGGCFAPGEWMPNTPIVTDPKYRILNATTLEIQYGEGWHQFTRCTTDTNPPLDYAKMPTADHNSDGSVASRSEPTPEIASVQSQEDPHRPACTSESCKQIETFLKKHYCGQSPAGNGPDDSCDLRDRAKRSSGVTAVADYDCEWNETTNVADCKQQGQITPQLRAILFHELQQLGLPAKAPGNTYFKIWQSDRVRWYVAQADYSHRIGDDIELCEVIALVDQNSNVTVLRKLPFTKTDVDVPKTTEWSLLDLSDTRSLGHLDIVLVGDAYEDHWLEVIGVENGSAKTMFSGLGYFL